MAETLCNHVNHPNKTWHVIRIVYTRGNTPRPSPMTAIMHMLAIWRALLKQFISSSLVGPSYSGGEGGEGHSVFM